MQSQGQNPKILDQVRDTMRLHHYSIHTERTYIDWIKRYIAFHRMKARDDLADGERKIEAFLTHLAIDEHVASATQNQAMNALVFLYKRVLQLSLNETMRLKSLRKLMGREKRLARIMLRPKRIFHGRSQAVKYPG